MSKSQNPMTGQMSGSMANFVTTTHGGQNVIRSKAFNQQDAKTESQMIVRNSFKLGAEEYGTYGGMLDQGFPERPVGQSAYNQFMAANLPGAIDKSGAVLAIDYSKLVVSLGSLPQVAVVSATVEATGIEVSYKSNLLIPRVNESDEVVLIAKTLIGELLVSRQVRGIDALGVISIAYPGIQAADVKCCYIFVLSANGSKASRSVYLPIN
jgi:hypothetical protein